MTYDAEGKVTVEDTIKRQFKPPPRSNVGRGGKRCIQDEGGIQINSQAATLKRTLLTTFADRQLPYARLLIWHSRLTIA